MTDELFQRPENIDKVFGILEELWGNEAKNPDLGHEEPLDGLILTLLSQNTNDTNRDRGFEALKTAYPEWDAAAAATKEEIADCIRVAGLANTKSERMLLILEKVRETFGLYSLKGLKEWSDEDARAYLGALPGIGAKTAACVMLFDLDKSAFPVDTHIARFCRRMEWASEKTAPEHMQSLLEAWVPRERFLGGHINIIEHGRNLCSARKPRCGKCPLAGLCPYFTKTGAL
ncbi:MAG: endonuclease III [Synergistaceae bacterium]|nr:endonuclease III [Synergistaceae bacterium]